LTPPTPFKHPKEPPTPSFTPSPTDQTSLNREKSNSKAKKSSGNIFHQPDNNKKQLKTNKIRYQKRKNRKISQIIGM
jgi:hypothetical protein